MTAATPDDRAVARVLTDRIPGLLPRPELVHSYPAYTRIIIQSRPQSVNRLQSMKNLLLD
jgi:hypothetical protein